MTIPPLRASTPSLAREHCQRVVQAAAQALCRLAAGLSAEEAAYLIRESATPRAAEARVDAAALRGDVRATKAACRAWWQAWQRVLHQHKET